jgi:hypothetical protein
VSVIGGLRKQWNDRRADSSKCVGVRFWDHVERQIAGRQAEAKLGGSPAVSHKVRAFVDLMLKDGLLPTSMEVSGLFVSRFLP